MTCIQESIRKIPCWQTEFKLSPLGAIHVIYRQIPAYKYISEHEPCPPGGYTRIFPV